MYHLSIVIWKIPNNSLNDDIETFDETDEYQEETMMYITDGKPNPKILQFEKGITMPSFFKNQRISLQTFRDLFPHCVTDNDPSDWDSPLLKCKVPRGRDHLIQLDKLINMPITLYEGVKNSKQLLKHIYYTGK